MLEHLLSVPKQDRQQWLKTLPARPAVFLLSSGDSLDKPYISRTANLQRRAQRLLAPSTTGSKRLYLGEKVSQLAYSEVGSEFETALLLLWVTREHYGDVARKRLHLRPPALLRLSADNDYPRMYTTSRIVQRALDVTYGPFASRAAAERFLDDSLNLFLLRRCTDDLDPDPAFPGCVYSEMKMCLAPCFRGCTDERYVDEVRRVREYFSSRGTITIAQCEQEREAASNALDFEGAAWLHQRAQKLKAAAQQAAPLVHALIDLNAVIVQPAYNKPERPVSSTTDDAKADSPDSSTPSQRVAVFLVYAGTISGPRYYSVEGMRHPNERAGSTSLFAQPTILQPTPLKEPTESGASAIARQSTSARGPLEERLRNVLNELEIEARTDKLSSDERSEHLSLLARWYYRPPARRAGEIFFEENGSYPAAKILRGISRVYCGRTEVTDEQKNAGTAVGEGDFTH